MSTSAHSAAYAGDVVCLQQLLEQNQSLLFTRDDRGGTLLHAAVAGEQLVVVRFLLSRLGEAGDTAPRTPRWWGFLRKRSTTRLSLVNAQASNGWTALHYACSKGNAELTLLLLERGANSEIGNDTGQTPLHLAAMEGHSTSAQILVDHGANVNACDKHGLTPLGWATGAAGQRYSAFAGTSGGAKKGQHQVAKILREHGGR